MVHLAVLDPTAVEPHRGPGLGVDQGNDHAPVEGLVAAAVQHPELLEGLDQLGIVRARLDQHPRHEAHPEGLDRVRVRDPPMTQVVPGLGGPRGKAAW